MMIIRKWLKTQIYQIENGKRDLLNTHRCWELLTSPPSSGLTANNKSGKSR